MFEDARFTFTFHSAGFERTFGQPDYVCGSRAEALKIGRSAVMNHAARKREGCAIAVFDGEEPLGVWELTRTRKLTWVEAE